MITTCLEFLLRNPGIFVRNCEKNGFLGFFGFVVTLETFHYDLILVIRGPR